MASKESLLIPLLTDEFLTTATEAAKTYWSGDPVEIGIFIEWLHGLVGKASPDLTPYEVESDS